MRHHDHLKGTPIFRDLTEAELDAVAAVSEASDLGPGDTLFQAGNEAEAIYIVALGTAEMTMPGHEMRLARFGSGQIIGVAALLLGGTYPATVTGVETTRFVKVPFAKLKQVMDKDPALALKVYRGVAHYLAHHAAGMASDRTTPYV
jgi:CRP-like cAMP-binding protein